MFLFNILSTLCNASILERNFNINIPGKAVVSLNPLKLTRRLPWQTAPPLQGQAAARGRQWAMPCVITSSHVPLLCGQGSCFPQPALKLCQGLDTGGVAANSLRSLTVINFRATLFSWQLSTNALSHHSSGDNSTMC